jgi:hypothetical protein
MNFAIKKETRAIDYTEKKMKSSKKAMAAAAIVLGVSILTGFNTASAGGYAKDGDIAMFPELKNKGEVMEIFKTLFKKKIPMNFKKDYHLKIEEKKGTIEFEADLYNSDAQIAVEWVSAPDYLKDAKSSMILSSNETGMILDDYLFGSTYILVLKGKYEYEIAKSVNKFIDFYMKQ